MAPEPLPLSQPEIEEAELYSHVLDQRHSFCDKTAVEFFEVCGGQKVDFEELGTEGLLAKLRSDTSGHELRVRVLYVENSFLFVLRLLMLLNAMK